MDIFDFQSPEDPDSVMPYFHTTGAHTNAGGHRIPDVAEAMLSNASRFLDFYNFTHNEKNNATGLWNDYAWSIAYYYSIKLHKEWDEVYHNLESNPVYWIEGYNLAEAHNESTGENASKYLSTQFNPLVVENTPPVVVKFTVRVEGGKLHYHIFIRDAGKIESVLINDETGTGYYVNNSVNAVVFEDNGTFTLSTSEQVFTVRIRVVAYDTATNKLDVSRDLHGPVGAIINCALRFLSSLFQALAAARQKVVDAMNSLAKWIMNSLENSLGILSEKAKQLQYEMATHCMLYILAVYSNETKKAAVEFLKIMLFVSSIAGALFGLYWALAIAVNANPLFGSILAGLVMAAFMTIFYLLYPEEYREAGEVIISVGELILMPADELYEFDRQYAGAVGWLLTAISAQTGVAWIGAVTNNAIAAFATWALSIVTLVLMLPLMSADYQNTTVKKVVAVALLAMASFGLVSTTVEGVKALPKYANNPGKFIVFMMFWLLFEIIAGYSVITLIGYLHKG